jgi:uncharacterized membrane protein
MLAGYFTRQTILAALCFIAVVNLVCAAVSPLCPVAHAYLHFFCHQHPARTFALDTYYYGLCARCAGLYSGVLVAFVLFRFSFMRRCFLFFAVSIALASILLKLARIDVPNIPRFCFGVCLGITLFVVTSFLVARFVVAFTASLLYVERKLTLVRRPNHAIQLTASARHAHAASSRKFRGAHCLPATVGRWRFQRREGKMTKC